MIIVRLKGGLGNQMFQYAAGFALARRRKTTLLLDTTFLRQSHEGDTPRTFQLHHLRISAKVARPLEISEATGLPCGRWGSRLVRLRRTLGISLPPAAVFAERQFHFDPGFFEAPGHVLLDGYWQSERYFKDERDELVREFGVAGKLSGRNRELADRIRNTASVSIHVRGGDYVTNPETNRTHGVYDGEYYRVCVEMMGRRVQGAEYFVFTDDPAWVRDRIPLPPGATLVDHNPPEAGHEDLRLMTFCRHHIIANSSFSWWSAWLSGNPGKIVIAPARWFRDPSFDTSDLLPPEWIQA